MAQMTLPIDRHLPEIIKGINPENLASPAMILTSSPGSGKTTRLPVALLKAVKSTGSFKKIVVLVPKRIAAVSAAQRICDENSWFLGDQAGFEVRFENKTSPQTQLIFMTTGLFLKKILSGNFIDQVGWIIFDEFHERLLENDFLLGYCRERKILNGDLQIIVMSATLSVDALKPYLETESVYQINEKPFKLEIRYSSKPQFLQCNDAFYEHLKLTTREALKVTTANLLIFLPGQREIHRATQLLRNDVSNTEILIFHGQLSLDEQKNVIQLLQNSVKNKKKYIILSTNICETSLTLPNTDGVIDCGLERNSNIEKNFGFSNLTTQRISQFSATQRAGRAARQKDGVCFRLWHKTDERSMRESVTPEILNRPLDKIFLFHCGLLKTDPRRFEWLTSPQDKDGQLAVSELQNKKLITPTFELSELGWKILSIPLEIDSAFLFYYLCENGFNDFACDYFCHSDDLPKKRSQLVVGEDDIDFIFNLPLSLTQKQKRRQLQEIAGKSKMQKNRHDFRDALTSLHFKFFKNRFFSGQQKYRRSYSGRGAELDLNSGAHKDPFFIALQGYESESHSTQITYALGLKKSDFQKWAESELVEETRLEFDSEKQTFYKRKLKLFGSIIVNDEGKQAVSLHEIQDHWESFLDQNFDLLMKDNQTYKRLIEKFKFIETRQRSQPDLFEFPAIDERDMVELKNLIQQQIKGFITDFNTLKNFDVAAVFAYLQTDDLKLKQVLTVIKSLPDTFTLATGRVCPIDFNDEKAPLISAKVQDFYGQKTHPRLLDDRIDITCELLAPNFRPTQVTKNLVRFWKESYFEVRKELKGRYPKHDWPENPEEFKKQPKIK